MIEVMFPNSSGLDVHKKTITGCAIVPKTRGGNKPITKTFKTTTTGLLELANIMDDLLTLIQVDFGGNCETKNVKMESGCT